MASQLRNLRSVVRAQLLFTAVCLIIQPSLPISLISEAYGVEESSKNLLKNGGFEEGAAGQPEGWTHFVAPADGAEAVWDETVHRSGKRSVMLHIVNPYNEEVYNNWYQHVPAVPTAKKLVLSAYVRSTDVTDAAMWLQCWRENSQEALRFTTTSVGYPISGTVDWTRVETVIVPPPETAFLTVRCVIAGKGTAWFDDVELVEGQERDKKLPVKATDQKAPSADQDALRELLEAHKLLLEVNKSLAENARLLMEELGRLRDELNELKGSIETWQSEHSDRANCTISQRSSVPPFRPAARNKRGTSRVEVSP